MDTHNSPESKEPRVDVEVRGDLLIMRYVGAFDVTSYEREVMPVYTNYVRRPGQRWRALTDIGRASAKDVKILNGLVRESRENKPFVKRAAWVGLGRVMVPFLFDRLVALSGRKDIKVFRDEAAAIAWLQRDD